MLIFLLSEKFLGAFSSLFLPRNKLLQASSSQHPSRPQHLSCPGRHGRADACLALSLPPKKSCAASAWRPCEQPFEVLWALLFLSSGTVKGCLEQEASSSTHAGWETQKQAHSRHPLCIKMHFLYITCKHARGLLCAGYKCTIAQRMCL